MHQKQNFGELGKIMSLFRSKKCQLNYLKSLILTIVNLPKASEVFFRITNAYLVMSKELYHVISQFNLGKTHFSKYIFMI